MSISNGILQIFFANKRQLIPISSDPPNPLKRPLHDGWQALEYSPQEIEQYAQSNNLGWRLSPQDIVIDVDPRNGGLEGLQVLLKDFQAHDNTIEDLSDIFPTVQTGGGGYHYYGQVPDGFKARNQLKSRYGVGIEFKGLGRQVIIPGSTHPSGDLYRFDEFSDYSGPSMPLPAWLLELIERPKVEAMAIVGESELTPNGLKTLLDQIPATDYPNDSDWFPLLAASHEATKGQGLDVFIEWSLTDKTFAGHEQIIKHRWESFKPGKTGNIGVGTLYKEVINHGGQLPKLTVDVVDKIIKDRLPPLLQSDSTKPIVKRFADRAQLEVNVQSLNPGTPSSQIKEILSSVALTDYLDQEKYVNAISKQTGHTKTMLRKALLSELNTTVEDSANDIANHLLQSTFAGGRHLVHAQDQRFWEYKKTHWEPMDDNRISNFLLSATNQVKQDKNLNIPSAALLAQSEKILRASRAVGVDFFRSANEQRAVVNTKNCEIWVDTQTGLISAKKHKPESQLINCLKVNFDPKSECPLFTKALQEIFEKYGDRDEIIRHLWELIGYIIQPQKDLATWVLFRGDGANGKTLVLNVITALLGRAALSTSIDELDTRRNNHAMANLPGKLCIIDEEVSSQTSLPDMVLKKISENKTLTANPKNRPTFEFKNTAIPVFAANHWPKTRDLSLGLRRRSLVFEFNRIFEEHEQDRTLGQRIIETELSGVLSQALKGFRRLRQRGNWSIPLSCEFAKKSWLTNANSLSLFIDTMVDQKVKGSKVRFGELYSTYKLWCIENGFKHQMTKPSFRKNVLALGLEIRNGAKNVVYVFNVALKKDEYND